jgi:hypothetical protein
LIVSGFQHARGSFKRFCGIQRWALSTSPDPVVGIGEQDVARPPLQETDTLLDLDCRAVLDGRTGSFELATAVRWIFSLFPHPIALLPTPRSQT